jgi:hypothetical protein
MNAKIISFPARSPRTLSDSGFHKALVAVTILLDFSAVEALQLIHSWVGCGLLSNHEAAALYAFYEWDP